MEKITFEELYDIFYNHNVKNDVTHQFEDKSALSGVVVFKQSNFTKEYSVEARSYKFRSDNKYFIGGMLGSSIFAESLDGSDRMRLDWYLGEWDIEYCYIERG